MAIRGPFVIPKRSPLFWQMSGRHWRFRISFPGAYMIYNRPRRKKRRI